MKKLVSLILMLCMMLSLVSAQAAVTPAGEFPIVDEPTELTIWVAMPGGVNSYNDSPNTKWMEEKTGVKVNFIEFPYGEQATLFNTSVASGDWPDIYMYGGSGAEILQYAEDGMIIPLNDLIENHSYYLKQRMEADPAIAKAVTAPDGNIWAFPRQSYSAHQVSASKLWVYSEWLNRYMEETGAEKPNTPEELEKMLIFFRDNDMNGNGDLNDEIMMSGQYNYGHDGGNPIYYVLNAFEYVPMMNATKFFFVDDEGNYTSNVMTDDMREGLKFINNMYKQGLIAEETFVQDLTTFRSTTTTTKDKVIVATAGAPYPFRLLTEQPGVENAVGFEDYEVLEPLQGKDGVAVTPAAPVTQLGVKCYITTACENPEVAMRWMDIFYSDEMILNMVLKGFEGTDWEWTEGENLAGGNKTAYTTLTAEEQTQIWNGDWIGARWMTKELEGMAPVTSVASRMNWECGMVYMPYGKQINLPQVIWCTDADLALEYAEQYKLLTDYIVTAVNEFVLGIRDPQNDKDWEDFKKAVNGMGYEDFIELATEYYGL